MSKLKTISAKLKFSKISISLLSTVAIIGVLTISMGLLFNEKSEANTNISEVTVYKSPTCDCCKKWVSHLRDAGFKVTEKDRYNMTNIKSDLSVSRNLQSCHTSIVDGYVVEGHVPADDIKRMLLEQPDVLGLTVPGMPKGSPGMESQQSDSYDVLSFNNNGQTEVYASYK
tara:strand:- start:1359 stop:1871 length:513 start_codon:yes stop_codon:yes gene_type:complete